MELVARYHDGLVALVRDVICRLEPEGSGQSLVITDLDTRAEVDRWNAADVFPLHSRKNELRIGVAGKPYGAGANPYSLGASTGGSSASRWRASRTAAT